VCNRKIANKCSSEDGHEIELKGFCHCSNRTAMSHDSSVGIALGYGLDDPEFESRQGLGIFFFATTTRLVLGLIQPPITMDKRDLSLGVKRLGRETDHPTPPSSEIKECVELYLNSYNTPSWCGTQESTGITLPLYSK
jgi:hypothetical protein